MDEGYNWYKGDKINIGIYGESHSERIGVRVQGIDSFDPDKDALRKFMQRRAPGRNAWSTPRKEADEVVIERFEGGIFDAYIENTNIKPHDYTDLLRKPRPGHADYTARVRYGDSFRSSGGGAFSGRLTAPLCIAGFLAKSILEKEGINISAHIRSIGDISDVNFYDGDEAFFDKLHDVKDKEFPVISDEAGEKMKALIESARMDEDSVGGRIEVVIEGLKGGIGGPIFEGIEARIASLCFAVPACKGVEFGNGFDATLLRGSENNDDFVFENGKLGLKSNRCGGILGGISTGIAPIVFDVAIKPTPTIAREQETVDLDLKENTTIKVHGRHDPCIVPRAVPVFEAVAAIAILDMI